MPLRELLYYPPFVAVVGLGLALILAFLMFIVHQRRGIRRLREGIRPGAPRVSAPTGAISADPAVTKEVSAVAPEIQLPSAILERELPDANLASGDRVIVSEAQRSAPLLQEQPAGAVAEREVAVTTSRLEAPAALPQQSVPVTTSEEKAPHFPAAEIFRPDVIEEAPAVPTFRTFDRQSSISSDVLRGALIVLAYALAVALALVVLPQSAFDKLADSLRYRNSNPTQQEMLAFLYLGDEAKGTDFHIRGAVRNITAKPIDELDATVRLYAPDRTLLETALVRMDSEHIVPDATATFHLTYPDYRGQIGSYSVDFKLRQGEPVPYKDMRGVRARD